MKFKSLFSFLIFPVCCTAPSWADEPLRRLDFPEYSIEMRCRQEQRHRWVSSAAQCVYREQAIAWLLHESWPRHIEGSADTVAVCLGLTETFEDAPSYAQLAICLMNGGNTGD